MKRHDRVIEPHTYLRVMMFGAGVLAVLLACAGTAAGVIGVVDDDDGGAGVDFCEVQVAAGVDRVHSTCASICAGLCAVQKEIPTPCKKIDYHSKSQYS